VHLTAIEVIDHFNNGDVIDEFKRGLSRLEVVDVSQKNVWAKPGSLRHSTGQCYLVRSVIVNFDVLVMVNKEECIHQVMNGCATSSTILIGTEESTSSNVFFEIDEYRSCTLVTVNSLMTEVRGIHQFVSYGTALGCTILMIVE
jgi:hypothetical protein